MTTEQKQALLDELTTFLTGKEAWLSLNYKRLVRLKDTLTAELA